MSEPAWLAADLGAASDLSPPSRGEGMRHSPQNTHSKEDDGKGREDNQDNVLSAIHFILLLLDASVVLQEPIGTALFVF